MDEFRIDSTKIMYHPHRVAQLLYHRENWASAKYIYPIYVEVSPVGACNHRCTFCAVDYLGYSPISMSFDVYRVRVDEMARLGVKSIMLAGEGEPLLHKCINDIVDATVSSGLDVAFTTNGVLLNRLDAIERCSWIKVSVNAGTPETYAKVHRTKAKDWDTVWSNIADAVKRKGRCAIGVQMVLLPDNQFEALQLEAICNEVGVDYLVLKPYSQHRFSLTRKYEAFKPAPPYRTGAKNVVIRDESIATTEIPYKKCRATPYLWAYIMTSGEVYSCSAYLGDDRFALGNINRETFQQIWEGEQRRANWELVKDRLDISECRVNCRMDKANRYLDDLAHGIPHQNFI